MELFLCVQTQLAIGSGPSQHPYLSHLSIQVHTDWHASHVCSQCALIKAERAKAANHARSNLLIQREIKLEAVYAAAAINAAR
jgi:hypothetical protein